MHSEPDLHKAVSRDPPHLARAKTWACHGILDDYKWPEQVAGHHLEMMTPAGGAEGPYQRPLDTTIWIILLRTLCHLPPARPPGI